VGAEHPQLLFPRNPENHCAEADPQNERTVIPANNEASPNDDRGMETFLPEDCGLKAVN
jgi:hypothetical protein